MGFIGKAFRGGLAVKATRIIRREAAKPENQRRAKSLFQRVTGRGSTGNNKPKGR